MNPSETVTVGGASFARASDSDSRIAFFTGNASNLTTAMFTGDDLQNLFHNGSGTYPWGVTSSPTSVTQGTLDAYLAGVSNVEVNVGNASFELTSVTVVSPEPSSLGSMFLGGLALVQVSRRKRS